MASPPILKRDAGKPRMDLIPPRALQEMAKVLAFGANKYSAHGWRQASAEWSRYIAAAYRHLTAFNAGEDLDLCPEHPTIEARARNTYKAKTWSDDGQIEETCSGCDKCSGLPHLAHAACCIFFLLEYQATQSGVDDRYKGAGE